MAAKKTKAIDKTSMLLTKDPNWLKLIESQAHSGYPGRDQWKERVIYTLLEWSRSPEALEVNQFCLEFRIPYHTLQDWRHKYPEVQQAYVEAKRNIATHRRVGSMQKKLDGVYAYRDMHCYDQEWISVDKYHAKLKQDEADSTPRVFVVNTGKPNVITQEEMIEQQKEMYAKPTEAVVEKIADEL